jgi:hypothetical protein
MKKQPTEVGKPDGENRFMEHIPGFIDRDPEPPFRFDTLAELMEQPQVKRVASGKDFSHFEQSEGRYLMAIYVGGEFSVVGYLDQPIDGLKEWSKE